MYVCPEFYYFVRKTTIQLPFCPSPRSAWCRLSMRRRCKRTKSSSLPSSKPSLILSNKIPYIRIYNSLHAENRKICRNAKSVLHNHTEHQPNTFQIHLHSLPSPYLLRTRFVPSSHLLRSILCAIERRWNVGNTDKVSNKTNQSDITALMKQPQETVH